MQVSLSNHSSESELNVRFQTSSHLANNSEYKSNFLAKNNSGRRFVTVLGMRPTTKIDIQTVPVHTDAHDYQSSGFMNISFTSQKLHFLLKKILVMDENYG